MPIPIKNNPQNLFVLKTPANSEFNATENAKEEIKKFEEGMSQFGNTNQGLKDYMKSIITKYSENIDDTIKNFGWGEQIASFKDGLNNVSSPENTKNTQITIITSLIALDDLLKQLKKEDSEKKLENHVKEFVQQLLMTTSAEFECAPGIASRLQENLLNLKSCKSQTFEAMADKIKSNLIDKWLRQIPYDQFYDESNNKGILSDLYPINDELHGVHTLASLKNLVKALGSHYKPQIYLEYNENTDVNSRKASNFKGNQQRYILNYINEKTNSIEAIREFISGYSGWINSFVEFDDTKDGTQNKSPRDIWLEGNGEPLPNILNQEKTRRIMTALRSEGATREYVEEIIETVVIETMYEKGLIPNEFVNQLFLPRGIVNLELKSDGTYVEKDSKNPIKYQTLNTSNKKYLIDDDKLSNAKANLVEFKKDAAGFNKTIKAINSIKIGDALYENDKEGVSIIFNKGNDTATISQNLNIKGEENFEIKKEGQVITQITDNKSGKKYSKDRYNFNITTTTDGKKEAIIKNKIPKIITIVQTSDGINCAAESTGPELLQDTNGNFYFEDNPFAVISTKARDKQKLYLRNYIHNEYLNDNILLLEQDFLTAVSDQFGEELVNRMGSASRIIASIDNVRNRSLDSILQPPNIQANAEKDLSEIIKDSTLENITSDLEKATTILKDHFRENVLQTLPEGQIKLYYQELLNREEPFSKEDYNSLINSTAMQTKYLQGLINNGICSFEELVALPYNKLSLLTKDNQGIDDYRFIMSQDKIDNLNHSIDDYGSDDEKEYIMSQDKIDNLKNMVKGLPADKILALTSDAYLSLYARDMVRLIPATIEGNDFSFIYLDDFKKLSTEQINALSEIQKPKRYILSNFIDKTPSMIRLLTSSNAQNFYDNGLITLNDLEGFAKELDIKKAELLVSANAFELLYNKSTDVFNEAFLLNVKNIPIELFTSDNALKLHKIDPNHFNKLWQNFKSSPSNDAIVRELLSDNALEFYKIDPTYFNELERLSRADIRGDVDSAELIKTLTSTEAINLYKMDKDAFSQLVYKLNPASNIHRLPDNTAGSIKALFSDEAIDLYKADKNAFRRLLYIATDSVIKDNKERIELLITPQAKIFNKNHPSCQLKPRNYADNFWEDLSRKNLRICKNIINNSSNTTIIINSGFDPDTLLYYMRDNWGFAELRDRVELLLSNNNGITSNLFKNSKDPEKLFEGIAKYSPPLFSTDRVRFLLSNRNSIAPYLFKNSKDPEKLFSQLLDCDNYLYNRLTNSQKLPTTFGDDEKQLIEIAKAGVNFDGFIDMNDDEGEILRRFIDSINQSISITDDVKGNEQVMKNLKLTSVYGLYKRQMNPAAVFFDLAQGSAIDELMKEDINEYKKYSDNLIMLRKSSVYMRSNAAQNNYIEFSKESKKIAKLGLGIGTLNVIDQTIQSFGGRDLQITIAQQWWEILANNSLENIKKLASDNCINLYSTGFQPESALFLLKKSSYNQRIFEKLIRISLDITDNVVKANNINIIIGDTFESILQAKDISKTNAKELLHTITLDLLYTTEEPKLKTQSIKKIGQVFKSIIENSDQINNTHVAKHSPLKMNINSLTNTELKDQIKSLIDSINDPKARKILESCINCAIKGSIKPTAQKNTTSKIH